MTVLAFSFNKLFSEDLSPCISGSFLIFSGHPKSFFHFQKKIFVFFLFSPRSADSRSREASSERDKRKVTLLFSIKDILIIFSFSTLKEDIEIQEWTEYLNMSEFEFNLIKLPFFWQKQNFCNLGLDSAFVLKPYSNFVRKICRFDTFLDKFLMLLPFAFFSEWIVEMKLYY